jgi:hypothetical protein
LAEPAETYVNIAVSLERISKHVACQPQSSLTRMSTSARGWSP